MQLIHRFKNDFLVIILMLIFISVYNTNIQVNIIQLVLNTILLATIILISKYSIITLLVIISNSVLVPALIQLNTGKSYGLLQMNLVPVHFNQMLFYIFIYNVIVFFWTNHSNILKNEKKLMKQNFNLSQLTITIICMLAIIFSIVAFPTLPGIEQSIRFKMLLPGNAWNHFVVVCLIILLSNIRNNRMIQITYIFVLFWFLSHGERVDAAGIILGLVLYLVIIKDVKFNILSIIKYLAGFIILATLFIYIGNIRINGDASIVQSFNSIFTFSTISDISYLYNISIDFFDKQAMLHGDITRWFLAQVVPLVNGPMSFTEILKQFYPNPGGEFILSGPLMDFGVLGIITMINIDFIVIKIILTKNNRYTFIAYLLLVFAVLRIIWYGRMYVLTAEIYFIPLLLTMVTLLEAVIKRKDEGVKWRKEF